MLFARGVGFHKMPGTPGGDVPRLTLRRAEAAASLGVSLDYFEEHVQPYLRLIRRGRVRLVPVRELEVWVARESDQPVAEELAA